MRRREFLLAWPAAALRADAQHEVYDLLARLANSLSEGDAARFLSHFDDKLAGYDELSANVRALVLQAEVHSTIDLVEDAGDARRRTVAVDWLMQLTNKLGRADVQRRQQTVKCRLEKGRGGWRVVGLEPIGFFAPPAVKPGAR